MDRGSWPKPAHFRDIDITYNPIPLFLWSPKKFNQGSGQFLNCGHQCSNEGIVKTRVRLMFRAHMEYASPKWLSSASSLPNYHPLLCTSSCFVILLNWAPPTCRRSALVWLSRQLPPSNRIGGDSMVDANHVELGAQTPPHFAFDRFDFREGINTKLTRGLRCCGSLKLHLLIKKIWGPFSCTYMLTSVADSYRHLRDIGRGYISE